MASTSLVDDALYRKEVLLLPTEASELSRGQKLADEAHKLGLKAPEIEAVASLTASIASGMVDLSGNNGGSSALSSGSSTHRNSACEQSAPQQQQQSGQEHGQQQGKQGQRPALDQVASSLSELTVSSGKVKSGSVRSLASLSTRPTSYCSSDGNKGVHGSNHAGNDGAATARTSAMHHPHNNRNSMMSVASSGDGSDKKEKRKPSIISAIGKIPFRRKRASSAVLLPPAAQVTVAKGEQGEDKVFVESKRKNEAQPRHQQSQSQSEQQRQQQQQATDTITPNGDSNSVVKLEVPVFDNESLQRSLVSPELVKMRESHRLERNRHVAFQDASMNRLRYRQQATVSDRLAENKRLEDEKREKNAANATRMEERQLAVEMEQQREFDRAKQNARTRIKHMEGYFHNRSPPSSPSSPGASGSGNKKNSARGNGNRSEQPRTYTTQQKAQLAQEYHSHESMDQLHEAKIKVLRERQERRLMETTERMENELVDLIDKHAEAFAELQKEHQNEECALIQALDAKKAQLRHRWNLEEAIVRRRLEMQHEKAFGPLPPLMFSDSHYETRDSAICVADHEVNQA